MSNARAYGYLDSLLVKWAIENDIAFSKLMKPSMSDMIREHVVAFDRNYRFNQVGHPDRISYMDNYKVGRFVKLQKLAQYCGVIAQRKMSVELNKVIQDSIDVKVPLLTLVQNLWKMKNGLYFLGYYCYYVDSDFELVKLLIGFRNCQGSHDAVNIGVWTC